jgi:hypothetical protein
VPQIASETTAQAANFGAGMRPRNARTAKLMLIAYPTIAAGVARAMLAS